MESSNKQYNNFANHYINNENFSPVGRVSLYKIMNELELEGKNILDLGCGAGNDLVYFHIQNGLVKGQDVSSQLLTEAKKKSKNNNFKTELIEESFEKINFPNNSLDLIYSRYALQHGKSIQRISEEVARTLKPHGDWIFLVTHPIRQFLEKNVKNYWIKELVESDILNNSITVKEYSHTMEEYLSPTILKNFTLEQFIEEFDPEAKQIEGVYPGYMILHYKKRGY